MDHLLSKEKELRKVAYENKQKKMFLFSFEKSCDFSKKMIFENWILIHDLSLKIAR